MLTLTAVDVSLIDECDDEMFLFRDQSFDLLAADARLLHVYAECVVCDMRCPRDAASILLQMIVERLMNVSSALHTDDASAEAETAVAGVSGDGEVQRPYTLLTREEMSQQGAIREGRGAEVNKQRI